jgi:hypothetical protein
MQQAKGDRMKAVGIVSTTLFALAAAALAALLVASLPEIKRYVKMEMM